jgi:hypothetical protein
MLLFLQMTVMIGVGLIRDGRRPIKQIPALAAFRAMDGFDGQH